jgi:dipicolinate synthase subunit B
MIGYAVTGSFCTHKKSIEILKILVHRGLDVVPIMSGNSFTTNTRFGKAEDLITEVEDITHHQVVSTICDAEKFGPSIPLEALIISPCTGNTLAKIAHGITDTSVCMAAKAHMRQSRPLLIALASNDGLSSNLANIATMLNRKNVFFVPMRQDDPIDKPHSLVCDFSRVTESFDKMMNGKQCRPIFI